jgi:2-polyprenyl-6-methoxyphenol hydroxylase-like FAD-dependent oxidoreductase
VVRHLRFYSEGRCLASLEFGRCGSRFGFVLDLPQDQTERLLRARVTELGGVVENGAELTGLAAGRDVVTATVGGRGTITAEYVVGCDGAHSRVRRELGLTFHGHPYPQDWLLADVLLDWDLREDAMHAFFRPDGLPVIFFPMRGPAPGEGKGHPPAPPDPGTGPVVLVRPDGHVAARGRPGRMAAVTGYLRDLFREPPGRFTLDAAGCTEAEGARAEAEGARAVPGP